MLTAAAAGTAAGAAGAGGAGVLGAVLPSIIGLGTSLLSSNQGYQYQADAAREDRAFAEAMWKRNAIYNSPWYQARLMQKGGFNPAALFDKGSSVAQMQQPSVGSHSVTPIMSELMGNPLRGISTLAQAMQSISQANKNTAEIPVFSAKANQLLSEAQLNDVRERQEKLAYELQQIYGSKMMDAQVNKLVSSYQLDLAEAALAASKQNTEGTIQALNKAREDLERSYKDLSKEQIRNLQIKNKWEETLIKSQLGVQSSQMSANYASAQRDISQANLNDALTKTENALRDGKITALNLSNQIDDLARQMTSRENVIAEATKYDKISAIVSQAENYFLITQEMREKVRAAMIDNDWREVQHFMKCFGEAVGSVTSVGNMKSMELNTLTFAQRNEIQREFNHLYARGRSTTNYTRGRDGSWEPVWHSETR